MALCSLGTLQQQAHENGFSSLDEESQRAVELQLWYNISGSTRTFGQLYADSCANGFMCASEGTQREIELQQICNLIGGV